MRIHRMLRLTFGTVIMLFSGILYAWSILKAPLMSNFGWNNAELGFNYTLTMIFFCVGNITAGFLLKKLSVKISMIIGAAVSFSGLLYASHIQGSLWALYISYGIFGSLGIGIIYNVVLTSVISWFPERRATASGVMMMGYGLSSLLLGPIAHFLIQTMDWRICYRILGSVILLISLIGCFFMTMNHDISTTAAVKRDIDNHDLAPQEMLRRASFWRFYACLLLGFAVGGCFISMAKDIAIAAGTSDAIAVIFVGLLSASNGVARILFGFLFDNFGRLKTMMLSGLITLATVILAFGAIELQFVPLTALVFILVGFTYGSLPPTFSASISEAYGHKNFAINFSITNTLVQLPASFSATAGGVLLLKTGSYNVLLLFLLACAIVMLFFCRHTREI